MGFVFDKCCFCIDLQVGCLIIGYLNLIGAIVVITTTGLALGGASVVAATIEDEEKKTVATVAIVAFAALEFFLVIFLAFTIVLLVGLHQYKRGHVKAYMIYTLIFLILYIIGFFMRLGSTEADPAKIVSDIFTILISIYYLLVIRSYYFKMGDNTNKPAVYNAA